MREFFIRLSGIFASAVYGLIFRLIFASDPNFLDSPGLVSITFLGVVPIIIGIIPIMFLPRTENLKLMHLFFPAISVLVFLIISWITRIEELVCIIIIAIPYMVGAIIGGLIMGFFVRKYRDKKGIMYSLLFLPFFAGGIESQFETTTTSYKVNTLVVIDATPEVIWQNIIRVSKMQESEFKPGFFNYSGVPRPLYAELEKDTVGAIRKGHFEEGLTFEEVILKCDKNKEIEFNIKVIPSTIRQTVFDQHILKGTYFKFANAAYKLNKIDGNKVELVLSSSYMLNTNINFYGAYWGDLLLSDFQNRLLDVIKHRCEKQKK